MIVEHHGMNPDDNQNPARLMKLFMDQLEKRARRRWPEGRAGAEDDGELAFAVAADTTHALVRIEFPKAVDWIGLPPRMARSLAGMLMEKAEEIDDAMRTRTAREIDDSK